MKNELMKIGKKHLLKNAVDWGAKTFMEHKGTILTGSTIFFNAMGIITTYRNSPKIHDIIFQTKRNIGCLDPNIPDYQMYRKQYYIEGFKQITPLVAPIILSFGASTGAAIMNQRQYEAKIATATAALSLAQSTISEYEAFKEEVKKEVGEEKFNQLKDEAVGQRLEEIGVDRFGNVKVNQGEYLCCIPDFNILFSSTEDRMRLAMDRASAVLYTNGTEGKSYGNARYGNEIVTYADVLSELSDPQIDIPALAYRIQWDAGRTKHIPYRIGSGKTRSGIPYLTLEINTQDTNLAE